MLQSRDFDIDLNINLNLSFAFNQISNIFYPKILYALYSAYNLLYIDLDITFYTSTLVLLEKEILFVLQSQGQAACLIADSQEKTTYRSAPF